MNTLISRVTYTNNILVNTAVAVAITLIAITLLALIINIAIDPSMLKHASFGGFNL